MKHGTLFEIEYREEDSFNKNFQRESSTLDADSYINDSNKCGNFHALLSAVPAS